MTERYYVYLHRCPDTQRDLYVGRGSGDRAYRMRGNPNTKTYSDRHPDHAAELERLYNKGYLPHQWTSFLATNLSRSDSVKIEKDFIKEFRPKYNRKGGPKKILDDKQSREVRQLYATQLYTYDQIGLIVGCSRSTVYRIIKNKRGIY